MSSPRGEIVRGLRASDGAGRDRLRGLDRPGVPEPVAHVDQATLEAAHRRAGGLALGAFLGVVGLRQGLAAPLGQRDDVDGAVALTVAPEVHAVTVAVTGGHGDRGDAGEGGERRRGVDAQGAPQFAEQPRGDDRPHAAQLEE